MLKTKKTKFETYEPKMHMGVGGGEKGKAGHLMYPLKRL